MIEVGNATEKDLEQILEIYNDAIINTTAVLHYVAQTIEARSAWFAQKQSDGFPVLLLAIKVRLLALEHLAFLKMGKVINIQLNILFM